MQNTSPSRRSSWSKHTSYPTVSDERAPQIPGELGAATRVNNKNAENDLKANRTRMNSMHRKSISDMDRQRKLLEKSMLAYSKKMNEISNTRTNELFREIHTRNASRETPRSQSPTSKSTVSAFSLPARFYRETSDYSIVPSLHDFPTVKIFSPIEESRTSETASDSYKRQQSGLAVSAKSNATSKIISRGNSSLNRETNLKTDTINENVVKEHQKENRKDSVDIPKEQLVLSKISPRIAAGGSSIPWFNDSSDSAYSSASEDIENDLLDEEQYRGNIGNTDKVKSQTSDGETKDLLTVPTLHVRRRNRKVKRRHQGSSELLKHAIIQRQRTMMNLKSEAFN